MSADNNITVVGNLTRDPELKYTPNGNAVVNLGIAVNRRWQNRQTQEWEEQVSFFTVTAWNQLAENVGDSLVKGNRVSVSGRLQQRSWENDEGEKRSVVEIVADDVAASLRFATVKTTRNPSRDRGAEVADLPPAFEEPY